MIRCLDCLITELPARVSQSPALATTRPRLARHACDQEVNVLGQGCGVAANDVCGQDACIRQSVLNELQACPILLAGPSLPYDEASVFQRDPWRFQTAEVSCPVDAPVIEFAPADLVIMLLLKS